MDIQETLRQGIAAVRAGEEEAGRELLLAVIQADENQAEAWLWLSRVVDSAEDKEICMENVLTLDPENTYARQELARLKGTQPVELPTKTATDADVITPSELVTPAPLVTPAVDLFANRDSEPIISRSEAERAGYLQEDEFDDPWLCPYCTARTAREDRVCPNCRRPLVIKRREQEERSVWLWRGFFLQLYAAFYVVVATLAYYMIMVSFRRVGDPLSFWPLYFGGQVVRPADEVATIMAIMPLWTFWMIIGVVLYALGLMLILYLRLPYGHLMYVVNIGLMFVLGLVGVFWGKTLVLKIIAGLGIALGALQLVVVMNIWKDFSFFQIRLRMKIDADAKTHTTLFHSARRYAELGMWGNAIIHLRRAAATRWGNIDYHLALVVAYINVKRYDLAHKSLIDAAQLNPRAREVRTLRTRLAALTQDIPQS